MNPWGSNETNKIHGTEGEQFRRKLNPGDSVTLHEENTNRVWTLKNKGNRVQNRSTHKKALYSLILFCVYFLLLPSSCCSHFLFL